MTEYTFGQMIETAKEASDGTIDIEVPVGKYTATIVATSSGTNAGGKLYISAKFRIDDDGVAKNAGIWMRQYLSPENAVAVDIWFKTFEALGIPRASWAQFGADTGRAGADVATRIKGRRAQVTVKHEEYRGNTEAKVSGVRALSGSAPAQVAPAGEVRTTAVAAPAPAGAPKPAF